MALTICDPPCGKTALAPVETLLTTDAEASCSTKPTSSVFAASRVSISLV